MSIRTKILEKGKIIQEQLIRVLIDFDNRITTLEGGEAGEVTDISALKEAVGDKDSGLVKDVADIKTAIGTESTEGTILARIKSLEDKQPQQQSNEPSG